MSDTRRCRECEALLLIADDLCLDCQSDYLAWVEERMSSAS